MEIGLSCKSCEPLGTGPNNKFPGQGSVQFQKSVACCWEGKGISKNYVCRYVCHGAVLKWRAAGNNLCNLGFYHWISAVMAPKKQALWCQHTSRMMLRWLKNAWLHEHPAFHCKDIVFAYNAYKQKKSKRRMIYLFFCFCLTWLLTCKVTRF